jgi:hypothetical protein
MSRSVAMICAEVNQTRRCMLRMIGNPSSAVTVTETQEDDVGLVNTVNAPNIRPPGKIRMHFGQGASSRRTADGNKPLFTHLGV